MLLVGVSTSTVRCSPGLSRGSVTGVSSTTSLRYTCSSVVELTASVTITPWPGRPRLKRTSPKIDDE